MVLLSSSYIWSVCIITWSTIVTKKFFFNGSTFVSINCNYFKYRLQVVSIFFLFFKLKNFFKRCLHIKEKKNSTRFNTNWIRSSANKLAFLLCMQFYNTTTKKFIIFFWKNYNKLIKINNCHNLCYKYYKIRWWWWLVGNNEKNKRNLN